MSTGATVRMDGPNATAHLALLAGAFVFSGYNLVLSRCLVSDDISPVAFSLARELVSIVVMYTAAAMIERPLRRPSAARDTRRFVVLGCLLAAFQLCFTAGIALTDAMTAAVFQCIQPTTAALLGALTCSESISATKVASAVLAGAGVALIELNPARLATPGATANSPAAARTIGCLLLFLQGIGISGYCLVQKTLVREPASTCLTKPILAGGTAPMMAGRAEAPLLSDEEPNRLPRTWLPDQPPHLEAPGLQPEVGFQPELGFRRTSAGRGGCREGESLDPCTPGCLLPVRRSNGRAVCVPDEPVSAVQHSPLDTEQALFLAQPAAGPVSGGYGALTATAHAYCASTAVLLLAAGVDTAAGLETPAPISRAQFNAFFSSALPAVALAYAVFLASLVGYTLGAWANKRLDASTVVLYNAAQPPVTALLGLVAGVGPRRYGVYEAAGSSLVMLAVVVSARAPPARVPPSASRPCPVVLTPARRGESTCRDS
jgi:drug/metabolite transporter (DMT)-like permease